MSNVLKALMSGGAAAPLYVDDVFSTYLYTGNGSTQTITNGIDLAGKGGLVWLKGRSIALDNYLWDTQRGATYRLVSNSTSASLQEPNGVTSFNSSGFSIGAGGGWNNTGSTYVSWTFRKQPKFFDVVTYTGNGANRTIPHNLGSVPGCIITKRTDVGGDDWATYHRSLGASAYINLNTTGASQATSTGWNDTAPTSTTFSLGTSSLANASGGTYVAYLFAHDTAADGIIQCGSFTTDGSGNATVNLGWEPQYLLMKRANGVANWFVVDSMRGWTVGGNDSYLNPNNSDAETSALNIGNPTATGFFATGLNVSESFIYLAIRRPNKPPTSGTQVYNAIARTGTASLADVTGVGFTPDWVLNKSRSTTYRNWTVSRLTGNKSLVTEETSAEYDFSSIWPTDCFTLMDGVKQGIGSSGVNVNGITYINHFFRRAPGVFDVVCYTGTGSATTVAHNLGVAPELLVIKRRNVSGNNWAVYSSAVGATKWLQLNLTNVPTTDATIFANTAPTASVFSVGADDSVNASGATYVAYLFATKPGISKVGSYTGNGSSQTINCGFSTGARFFLVKATSTTGSWWVYDSTRGVIAAADPALQLNSTAAEVTTADAVDPDASGIIVNQEATCSINANGVSYVYLALS